jgi:hypothetical protein
VSSRVAVSRLLLAMLASLCAALAVLASDALASGNLNWGTGVEVTLPANAESTQRVELTDVSCPSAGECTAVGSYTDSSGDEQGLLLSETSGVWGTAVEASLPAGAATEPNVHIDSVSCPSSSDCAAVGYYRDSSDIRQVLLLTESSGTWATGVEAVLPANAATDPEVHVSDLSCPAAGECTAVGYYSESSGHQRGLFLTESSGVWGTGVEATLPANASASHPDVFLNGLACASAGNCVAVGQYDDASFATEGLILTETSGSWAAGVEAVLPANASSNAAYLQSVSCPSIGDCTAVGEYTDNSSDLQGLLLTESLGVWETGAEAVRPANAISESDVDVGTVSCPAAGDCTAYGTYWVSDTDHQGLLLTETSGTWAPAIEAPHPANTSTSGNEEASLSCPAVGDCALAAGYVNTSRFNSLLVTESAGVWGPSIEASAPANAGASKLPVSVNSVACSSPGTCTAVGEYEVSFLDRQGMILEAAPVSPNLSANAPSDGQEGSPVSPSAMLTGGAEPTGAVTFTVFGPQSSPPSSCVSGGTTVGGTNASGDGSYQPSTAFTPSAPGDYWWYASYGGDAGDEPAASMCGPAMAETTVPKATPTLSVSGPIGGVAGSPIAASSISATLTEGYAATGAITVTVFGPQSSPPSSCASGGTTVGTASVSGDGAYQPSAGFTPASTGDYWWYASYGGDAGNNPDASTCGPLMAETVVAAQTAGSSPGGGSSSSGSGTGTKTPAPTLSGVKLGAKKSTGKKGITLELTLSQPATIRVLIAQTVKAHKHGGVCKPTVKKGKSCTTTIEKRTLTFSGSAGSNALKLKLAGLGDGSYTATIIAENTNGKSMPIKLTFTITNK